MKPLDLKINKYAAGKVVRKDLTQKVKGNAIVPNYVLEYLLGQYCASDQEETIEAGIESVKSIIAKHFVYRDEAESVKSTIRERGNHRIIDKLSVKLNDRADRYEARFSNLGLQGIPIHDDIVRNNPKLLSEGVWSLINMGYLPTEERNSLPWIIESVKPIQIAHVDLDEYKQMRDQFSTEEWMDFLMQSIGLNPEEFSTRSKLIQLSRLIPFTENNYNLIELGPKGTGKSHIFSELSPHGILISGGEVSKAKLFVNNSTGNIGLVGYWDVIAYDEFAGKSKKTDRGLVDIMKNYMANKSFSRGTDVYQAEASMVFVGNTDHTVSYMMQHTHLFDALPKDYHDTAFLDRIHAYIPGWEVAKLRNELFTQDFGFIVDYIAEILKVLRKEDHSKLYQEYFTLSNTITTRDKTAIEKTLSGLIKIIYPSLKPSKEELKKILDFSIECRKRVKQQLIRMDETFNEDPVYFEYTDDKGEITIIQTLEEIEYADEVENSEWQINQPSINNSIAKVELKKQTPIKVEKQLTEGTKQIRENQTKISYDKLFGAYLEGADEFTIQDPYIRLTHQIKNFLELCVLIRKKNMGNQTIKIHLITWNDPEYMSQAESIFEELKESLEEVSIDLRIEFKESAHDRFISCNNGWKIILGRGLDIWQRTSGFLADTMQEARKCREFHVTVMKE